MRILRSQVSLEVGIRPRVARGKNKEHKRKEKNILRLMKRLNCGKTRSYFQKSASRSWSRPTKVFVLR